MDSKLAQIDARLRILWSRRWTAWNANQADEVEEYTENINKLLQERFDYVNKRKVAA